MRAWSSWGRSGRGLLLPGRMICSSTMGAPGAGCFGRSSTTTTLELSESELLVVGGEAQPAINDVVARRVISGREMKEGLVMRQGFDNALGR